MIEHNGKKYYPTIGLEIHAELATDTKMFCACKNDPDEERPNVNTCPVCMGHPGTLPAPNLKAIESVVKVGLAIGAEIANFSEFDRKNYFYPDIPKGYQISQYKYPIVSKGNLAGVAITRIHLEEDTGTSKHDRGDFSLVDFNRAGVPLMELVTEPVIHDSETAMNFVKELQLLLRTLGVAHANIEKGEMRIEPNISVSLDPNKLATKVEVKNIGSISSAGKVIDHEIKRMIGLYEAGRGDEIVQETRGWDEAKQSTYSQRRKENSNDYRYFPDPDIPKFMLHELFDLQTLKKSLPELPWQKRTRYISYGLKPEDAEIFIADDTLALQFEGTLSCFPELFKKPDSISDLSVTYNPRTAITIANFILTDFAPIINKDSTAHGVHCESFARLIQYYLDDKVSSRVVKDMIPRMAHKVFNPEEVDRVLKEENLIQQNDEGALKAVAQKYIDANPNVVAEYKGGKESALMFFVGQIMKETKGSANPGIVQKILKELLQ